MKLIACPVCHSQYDVALIEAEHFACRCGETLENRPLAAVDAAISRCGSCGAHVAAEAEGCGYCGSAILRDPDKLSLICPECFARNAEESRFCVACGVAFRPEPLVVEGHEVGCPACETRMPPSAVAGIPLNECPGCHGLWVPGGHFDALVRRAARAREQRHAAADPPRVASANPARQALAYRRCPECSHFMLRNNYRRSSGIILDECRAHGTWLDADELEQVAGFILEGERGAERAAAEAERWRGEAATASRSVRVSQPGTAAVRVRTRPTQAPWPSERPRRGLAFSLVDFLTDILDLKEPEPMGFMDKLRAELVDIVEWVDDSRHTLVWRFPRYRNQIKYGAQLIVRPGQMAIFVHRGRVADVFEPGQYRLETANLPVLSTLAGWAYGFDSPFKAEVYFVSTRQITDLKWGTPNPVPMRDPEFGPIRVRAFGTYTLKAVDPRVLLAELVGTDSEFAAEEIQELLRSLVNQSLADVLAKAELGVLDLASQYARLSEEVRQTVLARIDDEYGLEIPQLVIVNVSVPAEVEQALDARSSMGVLGDMAAYQQYQLGTAMPAAAENPAGGLAGAGVGVGMGMAMAGQWAPGRGPGAPPAAPGAAPPPPPPPAAWHIVENGQSVGPFSPEQLAQAAAAGRVGPTTLVWSAGMSAWTAAREVPGLAGLWAPPPPQGSA